MHKPGISMAKSNPFNNFEKQLEELESIVMKMEQGNLSLSDSLKSFEKGVNLTNFCLETLQTAELKVSQLQSLTPDATLVDFETDE